jgi:hypothetical protein
MTIETTRDVEGLKQALRELLEEAFSLSRVEKSMEGANEAAQQRMLASLPPRTLSPGYYKAAEYLLWLEQHLEVGAPAGTMVAWEADGLCVVARARDEFEREHPACGACGALQDSRWMAKCCACGAEFRRG